MALKESEAIVLRTYPMREADLLVTLFTRMEGKFAGWRGRREVAATVWWGTGALDVCTGGV